MRTEKEKMDIVLGFIASIKTAYPQFYKDFNENDYGVLAKTWLAALCGQNIAKVENAVAVAITKCKFPPTVAEILDIANADNLPNFEELWGQALRACDKITGYYSENLGWGKDGKVKAQQVYENLSAILMEKFRGVDDCLRFSQSIVDNVDHPNFNVEFIKRDFIADVKSRIGRRENLRIGMNDTNFKGLEKLTKGCFKQIEVSK